MTKSQSIYQILKKMVTEGPLKGKMKLPSTRVLSKQLGVSPVTVLGAVKLLEKDKLVFRKKRSGVYLGNVSLDPEAALFEIKKTAEDIARLIQKDILEGNLKVGSFLPMQKFLAFQYHTTRDTIRKALKLLYSRSFLHQKARHWIVGPDFAQTSSRTIRKNAYIIATKPPQDREFDDPNMSLFLYSFETELQKYGVTNIEYLEPEKYTEWISLAQEPATVGFTLMEGLWESDEKLFQKVIAAFSKASSPLAIPLYNYFLYKWPTMKPVSISHNIFPLWFNKKKIINDIAAYLAGLGHKTIACFSAFFCRDEKSVLLAICEKLKHIVGGKSESFYFDVAEKYSLNLPPLNLQKLPKSALSNCSPSCSPKL